MLTSVYYEVFGFYYATVSEVRQVLQYSLVFQPVRHIISMGCYVTEIEEQYSNFRDIVYNNNSKDCDTKPSVSPWEIEYHSLDNYMNNIHNQHRIIVVRL